MMPKKMNNEFLCYKNNELFADIIFEVQGRQFYGHALLFRSHNKYFRDIIDKKVDECQDFPLKISLANITEEKMEEILNQLYSGSKKTKKNPTTRFASYLKSPFASDIVLLVGDESIFCHRIF